ncbi:MAG: hypothetical protein ACM3Q4_15805 [Acidobacteriota bacterium]
MLISFRCIKAPAEPEMPTWQTQLSLPIVDRTYYFSELVAKDDKFETMVDGEIVYRPSNVVNTPTAVPMPTINPVTASVSSKLGTVPLDMPALPTVDLGVTELIGQAPPALPWMFGDATLSENVAVTSDTAAFDYIVFDNARMVVTLRNTMNFDVLFPSGIQLVNVFSDSDTAKVLATFNFGEVKAGQTVVMNAPLSGSMMSSRMKLKFVMQTVGLNGTVLDPAGKMSAELRIDGGATDASATMRSAKAKIEGNYSVPTTEGTFKVADDSIYICRAVFTKGGFDLRITNSVPVDIAAGIQIKELVNRKTRQPFRLRLNGTGIEQDAVIIPRNTTFVQPVDLSEYEFISQETAGRDTLPTNGVHYALTLKTLNATDDKRVISVTDSISASIIPHTVNGRVQEYGVSSFVGVINPTSVAISEAIETNFGDVSDKFTADSIKTDNATIVLKLYSPVTYPADLNLKVTAWRDGVKGLSMTIPGGNGGLNGSYRVLPGDTARIVLNKSTVTSGTTIDQFLNSFIAGGKVRLPDRLVLEGAATIQPLDVYKGGRNGLVGSATDHDSIYSSVEFVFPMRIAVNNGAFKDTVEFDNNMSDSDRKKLDLIENGKVTFEVENTFPVEGDLNLTLMRSNAPGDSLLNLTKTPIRIPAAQYQASGTNIASKSYSYITLDKGDASKFRFARFSAVRALMQTGNNRQPVSFRATDKIRVKAFGTLSVTADFNTLTTDDSK